MLFEINNPNPVPLSDFVANFVNNLGNISESIPEPVSFTLTIKNRAFVAIDFFLSNRALLSVMA
jgi:hypothetical protein